MSRDISALVITSLVIAVGAVVAAGDWGGVLVLVGQAAGLAMIGVRVRRAARAHPSRWS